MPTLFSTRCNSPSLVIHDGISRRRFCCREVTCRVDYLPCGSLSKLMSALNDEPHQTREVRRKKPAPIDCLLCGLALITVHLAKFWMEPGLTDHNACLFGFALCATNMGLISKKRFVTTVVKVVFEDLRRRPAVDVCVQTHGAARCNRPFSLQVFLQRLFEIQSGRGTSYLVLANLSPISLDSPPNILSITTLSHGPVGSGHCDQGLHSCRYLIQETGTPFPKNELQT